MFLVTILVGCDYRPHFQVTSKQKEIEISPGQWLTIKSVTKEVVVGPNAVGRMVSIGRDDSGRSGLVIPWQGKDLRWEGYPIPISLREWEDRLYLIGFDRTDVHNPLFRYYRQDADTFVEINRADFPKRIATQNMWLDPNESARDMNGKRIFELQVVRTLDVNYPGFRWGLTAQMWIDLDKGPNFSDTCTEQEYAAAILHYREQYAPIALPTIIRTSEDWPASVERTQRK